MSSLVLIVSNKPEGYIQMGVHPGLNQRLIETRQRHLEARDLTKVTACMNLNKTTETQVDALPSKNQAMCKLNH